MTISQFPAYRLVFTTVFEGEEAAGAGDVAGDLCAQGFDVGETLLGAEAEQEGEAERGLPGERDGVEVQQVGLDGEGRGTEGGADTDVGDGVEGFGGGAEADGKGGDVNAVGGEKLRVGLEVNGGDGIASAEAAAGGGVAVDGEGTAEQDARLADGPV